MHKRGDKCYTDGTFERVIDVDLKDRTPQTEFAKKRFRAQKKQSWKQIRENEKSG